MVKNNFKKKTLKLLSKIKLQSLFFNKILKMVKSFFSSKNLFLNNKILFGNNFHK